MFITLKWTNLNTQPVVTEIYRSTTPIDRTQLPATPITTLSAGETEYTDTQGLVYGQKYFYVLNTIMGVNSVVSPVYEAWALPYSGPGPQSLIYGDVEAGYYGYVTPEEFIYADKLIEHFGIDGTAYPVTAWNKFTYKQKTLYIPNTSIVYGVSLQTLYNKGILFGVAGEGPNGNLTGVNQYTTYTHLGREYLVRAPRLTPPSSFTWDGNPASVVGEWPDLIARLLEDVPEYQKVANWENRGVSSQPNATRFMSGLPFYTQTFLAADHTKALYTTFALESLLDTGFTSGLGWLPVLELLPPAV